MSTSRVRRVDGHEKLRQLRADVRTRAIIIYWLMLDVSVTKVRA
jgi:hypothetical protein